MHNISSCLCQFLCAATLGYNFVNVKILAIWLLAVSVLLKKVEYHEDNIGTSKDLVNIFHPMNEWRGGHLIIRLEAETSLSLSLPSCKLREKKNLSGPDLGDLEERERKYDKLYLEHPSQPVGCNPFGGRMTLSWESHIKHLAYPDIYDL